MEFSRELNGVHALMQVLSNRNETDAPKLNRLPLRQYLNDSSNASWCGVSGGSEYAEKLRGYENDGKAYVIDSPDIDRMNAPSLISSVSGQFNDVSAYIAGMPECMADFSEQSAPVMATIAISAAVPGNMELKKVQNRALAVLKGVNALESKGVRCRIVLEFRNQNKSDDWDLIVKDHQDSYVPNIHGYAIGDYSTVRAAGYAYWALFNTAHSLGQTPKENRTKYPDAIKINYCVDDPATIESKFKTFS